MNRQFLIVLAGLASLTAFTCWTTGQEVSPPLQLQQIGGGFAFSLPDYELKPGSWQAGAGYKVARSKSGRIVYAFFPQAEHWAKLDAVFQADDRIVPLCTAEFVGFKVRTRVYACSAGAAHWETLEVPESATVSVGQDSVSVTFDDKMAEFTKSGRWSVLNLSQD